MSCSAGHMRGRENKIKMLYRACVMCAVYARVQYKRDVVNKNLISEQPVFVVYFF